MKIINRRARHDYQLLDQFEVGIVLTGAEVKSAKAGQMSLKESFAKIREGEVWLHNAHIHPYPYADNRDYQARRPRKLLLHKKEIVRLAQKTKEKGLTLVPISCYTKGRNVKLKLALAKAKKSYQKKEAIKRRDLDREAERALREKT